MRVLYLGMTFNTYGSPSHEALQARTMAEMGHEVTLVINREPPWKEPLPSGLQQAIAPLDEWLQRREYSKFPASRPDAFDVAFASSASGAPFLDEWKKATGRPTVVQVLDLPLWRLQWGGAGPWLESWRPWYRALASADRIVTNTERTRDTLAKARALYPDEPTPGLAEVVYYGIDTAAADAAEPMAKRELVPQDLAHRPQACAAARLVPYKGYDLAIAALSLLAADQRPVYHIVGQAAGHEQEAMRLTEMAQLSGVDLNIFSGGITDVQKFGVVKACDFGLYLAHNPDIPSQFPLEAAYCLPPWQDVMTNTGLRKIGALDVGDVVRTHTGHWRPVVKTYSREYRGYLLQFRTKGENGAEFTTTLTPEHPVFVRRLTWAGRYGRAPILGPLTTIQASDVRPLARGRVSDYMVLPRPMMMGRPVQMREDFLRLSSTYVAEGSLHGEPNKSPRMVVWSLGKNNKEAELAQSIANSARALGYKPSIYENGGFRVRVCDKGLAERMNQQFGRGARHKRLPGWVLRMRPDQRWKFFSGYLEGDGWWRERNGVLSPLATTVSRDLAVGLRDLALTLGFTCSTSKGQKTDEIQGRRVNAIPPYLCSFTKNERSKLRNDETAVYLAVKEVRRIPYSGLVHNLAVAVENSYCTQTHAVHNCGRPCIVADIPINRERFGDHGVVYATPPFNTWEVARQISRILGRPVVEPAPKFDFEAERTWIRENRSFRSHAEGVLRVLEAAAG